MSPTRSIRPNDPRWVTASWRLLTPRAGESLAGYRLRMERLNLRPAGSAERAATRTRYPYFSIWSADHLLQATDLDLRQLAARGALDLNAVKRMTLIPLRRWLYSERKTVPGRMPRYQVCPAHMETEDLPLLHLLPGVTVCLDDDLVLINRCDGRTPKRRCTWIRPFRGQVPFRCRGCRRHYSQLPRRHPRAAERERQRRWQAVYVDLLRIANSLPPPMTTRVLIRAVRLLCNERRFPGVRATVPMTLHKLVETLVLVGASADELLAAQREAVAVLSREPLYTGTPRCPNPEPSCRSSSLLRVRKPPRNWFLCRCCGTLFTQHRIVFSFVDQPRFPRYRSARNRAHLDELVRRVERECERFARRGDRIVQKRVLAAARVPNVATFRAGPAFAKLVAVIRGRQS